MNKKWTVFSTRIVDKEVQKFSEKVLFQLRLLFIDLENNGPILRDWPNYSKLHGKKVSSLEQKCFLFLFQGLKRYLTL